MIKSIKEEAIEMLENVANKLEVKEAFFDALRLDYRLAAQLASSILDIHEHYKDISLSICRFATTGQGIIDAIIVHDFYTSVYTNKNTL